MQELKLKITIPDGLHARPAAIFVKVASRYSSELEIQTSDKTANGKSIIGIMSLGAFYGEEITLIADGPDERELLDDMNKLFENNFQEV